MVSRESDSVFFIIKKKSLNRKGDALLGKRPFLTNIQKVYKVTNKRKAAVCASENGAHKNGVEGGPWRRSRGLGASRRVLGRFSFFNNYKKKRFQGNKAFFKKMKGVQ